eukprot:CAMPEP_0119045340 /NCGR_PEP_ID=MMETSP1177-20130426/39047_1 /TAXON_ID=2985 /ORGANISM="Ochromonas sp, Strain CCMP1899" /LENGTH=45 /DNA_ID= /DNA_START= /DNA_END= /DNA_ORIENTATION=
MTEYITEVHDHVTSPTQCLRMDGIVAARIIFNCFFNIVFRSVLSI